MSKRPFGFTSLNRVAKKTANHPRALAAKMELRCWLLDEIGRDRAAVFDAYAGAGEMYRRVWCGAFNLFDLDPFGSPWERAMLIAARRPLAAGERIGIALTEGSGIAIKVGALPAALRALTEIARGAAFKCDAAGLRALHMRALRGLAARMEAEIVACRGAAGKSGAMVQYYAVLLEGRHGGRSRIPGHDSVKASRPSTRAAARNSSPAAPE